MTPREAVSDLRRKRAALRQVRLSALAETVALAVKEIRSVWPVDTGISRDGFRYEIGRDSLTAAVVFVKNDVPYTGFVHDGKIHRLIPELLEKYEPTFQRLLVAGLSEL